jgi:plastocyanin
MFVPVVLLIASLLFSSCSKDSEDITLPPGSDSIYIRNGGFSINDILIRVGRTVTWVNADTMKHSVTADDGSFDSGDILPGQLFSLTFNNVGIYDYYSRYKTSMRARVSVQGIR